MKSLTQRLSSYIAMMAPHHKERMAGVLIVDAAARIKELESALSPLASLKISSFGRVPDEDAWLWKPSSSNELDCPGINIAHVKAAKKALLNQ